MQDKRECLLELIDRAVALHANSMQEPAGEPVLACSRIEQKLGLISNRASSFTPFVRSGSGQAERYIPGSGKAETQLASLSESKLSVCMLQGVCSLITSIACNAS